MNSPNAIQIELNELSSNLPFENKQPVFTVPEGYFENFAAAVWAKIKSQHLNPTEELQALSPVLAAIPRKMPFTVPENYFDQLSSTQTKNEEELPMVLQQVSRNMPYAVPQGYFDGLTGKLLQQAKPKAKVISFPGRIIRYAAAAAIIGLLVLGGIFVVNSDKAKLDPTQQSEAWVAEKLEKVSTKELDTFIKSADVNPNGGGLAGQSSREVRILLSDVSTSELEAFLNEVPTDNEELSVIN